jgi:hypothetical protein
MFKAEEPLASELMSPRDVNPVDQCASRVYCSTGDLICQKYTEILRRISINSWLLASECMVSGNRVFENKIYGVWDRVLG